MIRFAVIAVFSLGVRLLAMPMVCVHPVAIDELEMVSPDAAQAEMTHCHEHEDKSTKPVPCNHMKQCLLDIGDDGSLFQKSMTSAALSSGMEDVQFVAVLTRELYPASPVVVACHLPPPGTLESRISVYVRKSSFLI